MTDAEHNGPEKTFHDTERKLRARIEALELALTQSRAETAAAYEQIADEVCKWSIAASEAIRALATPDQTAALDAVRAEVLDAASAYMDQQYGNRALSNPIDRQRILAAIKGDKA